MAKFRMCLVAVLLLAVPAVAAQQATQESTQQTTQTTAPPAPPPGPNYSGDWLSWPKMTGDWGGMRTQLANAGIELDINYTQIVQGNAHGGKSTNNGFRASGNNDIELRLDTGKMGLWAGGMFIIHAESLWGGGIDRKVGSLLPVNFNAALPGSAEPGWGYDEGCRFLLSEFIYQQVLFEGKLILLGGKLWGGRAHAFDDNMFANDEHSQFMNTGLRKNVLIPPFLPYTDWGVGVIVNPTPWLSVLTAVADSEGRAKTTGFETTFHGDMNTSIIHEWSVKVEPFGLPGHQRVGFAWSSMDYQKIKAPWLFDKTTVPVFGLLGPDLAQKVVNKVANFDHGKDNVMVYYNFDQYLYTEANDPTQGIGMFGRFGWARQDVNPGCHFYSIGMGGRGLIPGRDKDTCGVGYYFLDLSNDLPVFYHSEQGMECYYNVEIAPWLHISPDLQVVVNPGGADFNDVSVVYGLRMQMDL